MFESILPFITAVRVFARSRSDTALEVLALRQLDSFDELFRTAPHQVWSRWAKVLVIVKGETVIGWHRTGFRLYWR